MPSRLSLIFVCCLSLFACKEKQKSSSAEEKTTPPVVTQQVVDSSVTYFSVKDYFDDQWKTRSGNPYTLLKLYTVNGKTDSSYIPMDNALWASIRAPFDAADIGDKKFLGQYRYDSFDDETTQTTHLFYESVNPDLYLQKMDVAADMSSQMVKSVYLETRSTQGDHQVTRKLQYIPDRTVQIQEFEKTAGQPEKNTRLEYRFKY